MSHLSLWEQTIYDNRPITVCEDDAIFNYDFEKQADAVINMLPADWHIMYWGWNFDAEVLFDLIPGVSGLRAHFNQERMRRGIAEFQRASLAPRPLRLLAAFGTVCYTISPAGARTLRQACVPVRRQVVRVPPFGKRWPNVDISAAMLAVLPRINAFASLPPLVITKNDNSTSTTLPSR